MFELDKEISDYKEKIELYRAKLQEIVSCVYFLSTRMFVAVDFYVQHIAESLLTLCMSSIQLFQENSLACDNKVLFICTDFVQKPM